MKNYWQLQEAKARFSELFSEVCSGTPQYVSRRGKEKIVCISIDEYDRLRGKKKGFAEHLAAAPKLDDAGLTIERSKDSSRDIEL